MLPATHEDAHKAFCHSAEREVWGSHRKPSSRVISYAGIAKSTSDSDIEQERQPVAYCLASQSPTGLSEHISHR